MTTIAILYGRVSPRPVGKNNGAEPEDSIGKQISVCRRFCELKGYSVKENLIFIDELLTGLADESEPDPEAAIVQRKGLIDAIGAIGRGMVLVVRWRSRIARDPYIYAFVKRKVARAGGRIEIAEESNGDGMAYELVENTLAIVNKYQAIQARVNTKLAMIRYQKEGRRMTSTKSLPYGMMLDLRDTKKMIPNPMELLVLQRIKNLHNSGMKSPYRISRTLDQEGFRRRCGRTWLSCVHATKKIMLREGLEIVAEPRGRRGTRGLFDLSSL
jgi:hypothetical protein